MPTTAQLRNIWLISDTILYPEAVAFIRRLVRDQDCKPLPTSQVNGLLSIAEAASYATLSEFIVHQYSRNWPPRQRYIKTFYQALAEALANMQQRLRGDFHLIAGGRKPGQQNREEEHELMALLAREFIQHIIAENGLLAAQGERERRPPANQHQPTRTNAPSRPSQTHQPTQQRSNRG